MLSDPNSEFEEVVNYDLLSTLAPAHDLASNLQRFKRGTRDSASRLPVEEAIAETSDTLAEALQLVSACAERAFWVLADLLHGRG